VIPVEFAEFVIVLAAAGAIDGPEIVRLVCSKAWERDARETRR